MNTTQATATVPDTTTPTTVGTAKLPKTTAITLKANGTTLTLLARRLPDGTAETFVTTTDPDKKTTRGMTEKHATFEAAKVAIAASASKAEKLGWVRRAAGRGFVAKPDAFATLPTVPKAVPQTPKAKK